MFDDIDDPDDGDTCPFCGDAMVEDGPDGRWCPACGSSFD